MLTVNNFTGKSKSKNKSYKRAKITNAYKIYKKKKINVYGNRVMNKLPTIFH